MYSKLASYAFVNKRKPIKQMSLNQLNKQNIACMYISEIFAGQSQLPLHCRNIRWNKFSPIR